MGYGWGWLGFPNGGLEGVIWKLYAKALTE